MQHHEYTCATRAFTVCSPGMTRNLYFSLTGLFCENLCNFLSIHLATVYCMRTNAKVCRRQLDGHTVHFQMSSAQYTIYAAFFKGPVAVKEIAVRAFQVARASDIACNNAIV